MKTTKLFQLIAVCSMVIILVSCQKDPISQTEVVHSSTVPSIVCQGMQINNIFEIESSASGSSDFMWSTNVPCLIGEDESASFLVRYNPKSTQAMTGTLSYTLSWNENSGYTQDAVFAMVQSATEDKYYVYDSYGALETIVTYRIHGKKGTNYINFSDTKNWKNTEPYYTKGKIVEISGISRGSEEFMKCALHVWDGYFRKMGHQPEYSYDAQYVTLTLSNDQGNVDIKVYGKTRDSEIEKLLKYVKVGDTVEVPAIANSVDDVKEKNLQQVHTSRILKIE